MKGSQRIVLVAAIFALLFGFLGIRLWFMQVAEGVAAADVAADDHGAEGLGAHELPPP